MNSDEIPVRVQYDITYECRGVLSTETRIEDYKLNAFDYSPNKHYLYASGTGLEGEKRDSIPIWVISFEIDEENVTKYFNPYKPDSARIKYRLEPPDYANPDISPKPIRMKVEIKDKDGNLVYGPRDLTVEEQRNQLLWWKGIDNKGDTVKVEKGPFKVELTLKYKEDKEVKDSVDIGIVYVDLVVFNLRNGPPVSEKNERIQDSSAITLVNEDDDGLPKGADMKNEVIDEGGDTLDMVKLRLKCELPETFVDGTIEFVEKKVNRIGEEVLKDTAVVRIFDEKDEVIFNDSKEQIELKEILNKSRFVNDSIDFWVEGVRHGCIEFMLNLRDENGEMLGSDTVSVMAFKEMGIEYRYMKDQNNNYDCLLKGRDSLENAFKKGYVIPKITYGDSIIPAKYPKLWDKLMRDITDVIPSLLLCPGI
ncbi:MAG: hypothetical protein ABIN61_09015 [candidate division WOR-3 bacterium]